MKKMRSITAASVALLLNFLPATAHAEDMQNNFL
jgi:hypothetical protein